MLQCTCRRSIDGANRRLGTPRDCGQFVPLSSSRPLLIPPRSRGNPLRRRRHHTCRRGRSRACRRPSRRRPRYLDGYRNGKGSCCRSCARRRQEGWWRRGILQHVLWWQQGQLPDLININSWKFSLCFTSPSFVRSCQLPDRSEMMHNSSLRPHKTLNQLLTFDSRRSDRRPRSPRSSSRTSPP